MDSSNDHLICRYLQPAHELNEVRILPCGETVCQACIFKSVDPVDELQLDCLLCKTVHKLKDIIPNKLVNNLLENKRQRSSVIVPKENKALESLKKLNTELMGKPTTSVSCSLLFTSLSGPEQLLASRVVKRNSSTRTSC